MVQSLTRSQAASRVAWWYSTPTHSAGRAHSERHGPPSAPRISRKRLRRTSGNSVVRWSDQSLLRGQLARQRRQAPFEEIAKALAGGIDVLAVAVDEVHRHIQHVLDVALEAHAVLEHERQDAAAVGIGVGPDVTAIAEEAVRPALGERRVGEQRRRDRLPREPDPELLDHVGLGGEVEVGLDRARAQHHVEAELAPGRHVARMIR